MSNYFIQGIIFLILIVTIYIILILALIFKHWRQAAPNNLDTLLILGAKVNGTPAEPSRSLAERLNTAYHYLIKNPKTSVIVSGGQGPDESATEASVMAQYLIKRGIEKDRILLEEAATRTEENIRFSSQLTSLGEMAIVTNDYHVYRGMMLARRQGCTPVFGLAAPSKSSHKYKGLAREVIALGYALIFDR